MFKIQIDRKCTICKISCNLFFNKNKKNKKIKINNKKIITIF